MTQKNKIALVTGGSRGLGKNIALKLADKGFDVIITYHTKKQEALQVAEDVIKAGVMAVVIQLSADKVATFPDFFESLKETLKENFNSSHFDYLVNNAGFGFNAPFAITTEDQFDQLMNIQFKGVYSFTQYALPYLNDHGGIVNLSSRLSQAYMPGYSAYAAVKGAVETLTRYEAKELAVRGIRVNAIAPGPIATDFAGGVIRDNPQYNANVTAMTSLGRVGVPEDIGGVVAFLCSDDARWITAQRIEVSGGMNL
ncbi:SDR family NAD(P)-dependent oxidoreductase [Pedobacter sp. L105]|uniref:SDR family NAD(P)-dependent oxidoreductase n=1 Tax=Pedobacter sp. L105 TaxID=1641871 RepID=UPI00131BBAFA|nr:SDR family oxidoreductase [Pedobacter sp. L105]